VTAGASTCPTRPRASPLTARLPNTKGERRQNPVGVCNDCTLDTRLVRFSGQSWAESPNAWGVLRLKHVGLRRKCHRLARSIIGIPSILLGWVVDPTHDRSTPLGLARRDRSIRPSGPVVRSMYPPTITNMLTRVKVVTLGVFVELSGCGAKEWLTLVRGTYTGELICSVTGVDDSGAESQWEFTQSTVLVVGPDGDFTLNGEALVLGQQVLRSIPTADLLFEITEIEHKRCVLTFQSEPRPTLPGIGIDGVLVETYEWTDGSIVATSRVDLQIADASGTLALTSECDGTLTPP